MESRAGSNRRIWKTHAYPRLLGVHAAPGAEQVVIEAFGRHSPSRGFGSFHTAPEPGAGRLSRPSLSTNTQHSAPLQTTPKHRMSDRSEASATSLACVADRVFSPPPTTKPTMLSRPLHHAPGPTSVSQLCPIVPADPFSSRSQQCVPSSSLEQDTNLRTGPASSPPAPKRRSTSAASAQEGPSASAYKKAGNMLAKRLALREQEQEQERRRQKAERE
jgi:hypothetical protein